ncbi:hypothetical protein HDU82_002550 [Entophlyctis luteolus]|nr:hypothetical protein HDU82_002550 [Entophlyctis luteolus]KAJ3389613.1 hypothetical protein HDU84_008534 [Entophlyctis sp. JEL0112]
MSTVETITHAALGATFGFAMEKAKMHLPSVIINQLRWTQYEMAIVFLTPTLVGLVAISALEYTGHFQRSPKPPLQFINAYGANILGGGLIGLGMALSGACPGTVLVQLGTGIPTAPFLFAGSLFGSVSIGYFYTLVKRFAPNFGDKSPVQILDSEKLSLQKISIVASAIGFGILWHQSKSIPWRTELFNNTVKDFWEPSYLVSTTNPFGNLSDFTPYSIFSPAWSPFAGGLSIGAVQVLSILVTGSTLGISSVYPYFGSVFARSFDKNWKKNAPYFSSYTGMFNSLTFAVGTAAGSYLSMRLSGFEFGQGLSSEAFKVHLDNGTIARLFAGGFVLVYGSRIAGGCTSGHGLSGLAQLSVASFVTVAAMFAFGTASALLLGGL